VNDSENYFVVRASGPRRHRPPIPFLPGDNVVPGEAAIVTIVWRDGGAAIALGSVRCYPNGFGFTVSAHSQDGFPIRGWPPRDDGPEEIQAGVILADERGVFSDVPGASEVTGQSIHPDGDLYLLGRGSGGGMYHRERQFFVSPLPPPGLVTFVFTWPLYSVERAQIVVDAEEIRAAAARSITLWTPIADDA
jgi:hypothetical protein